MYWHPVEAAGPLRPPFAARHIPRAMRRTRLPLNPRRLPAISEATNSPGDPAMTAADQKEAEAQPSQTQPFQADVAKLLHLMVHSVYSDKSVFLRELIANAADACERLRYEAIAEPALIGDDVKPRITVSIDAENKRLTVEDNGIGMR